MSRAAASILRGMRVRGALPGSAANATQGTDLRLMRESNRMLVLNCIREQGTLPRAEAARRTGLSRTTVGHIIDELIADGFLREGDSQRAPESAGRRVIPVHFNASAGYVLGVSLGRSHLTLLVSDLAAHVIDRKDVPFAITAGPEYCLSQIVVALRAFVADHGIHWDDLIGVGIGMAGAMNAELTGFASRHSLPEWDGVDVQGILKDALNMPVYLENNANLGALGEMSYGAGRGVPDLLYVKAGMRIGSGLVINSEIYRGSSGTAGEIGHMTVLRDGPLCDCGNHGCLKTLASVPAILAAAQRERLSALGDFNALIAAAQAGDEASGQALTQAGEWIGIALASLVNVLNPALIVLDGQTMRAGNLIIEPIRQSIAAHSLAGPLALTRIVPSALSGRAIALGGVALVLASAFDSGFILRSAGETAGSA